MVQSDCQDDSLRKWAENELMRSRLFVRALKSNWVTDHYDLVVIDTQGAVGALQAAAAFAANLIIVPVVPSELAVAELRHGTLAKLLGMARDAADEGQSFANVFVVISQGSRTLNAEINAQVISQIADEAGEMFRAFGGKLFLAKTHIPSRTVFAEAASCHLPVHWLDTSGTKTAMSAASLLHELAYELFPWTRGKSASPVKVKTGVAK